jgi:rRNA maturation protein Rpf1
MNRKTGYVFVIERRGRPAIMQIVAVEDDDEMARVQALCNELRKEHNAARVQYARHPDDDTIVIMKKFDQ